MALPTSFLPTASRPLKLLSLFSGIGAFERALENLHIPFTLVNYCEIDKTAAYAYSLLHNVPESLNLRDVTTIDTSTLPRDLDLITYGFPCVPAGYLINTEEGYKPIETILPGDSVLTHTNTYKSVVKTMDRESDHIYHIKGVGAADLQLTAEHPIYTYNGSSFVWKKVKDLTIADYLCFNVNQNATTPNITPAELWLMGRYIADGYRAWRIPHKIFYAIGYDKIAEFEAHIPSDFSYVYRDKIYKGKVSCREYKFTSKRLESLLEGFGTGSKEKKIPQYILDIDSSLLFSFLDGYLKGDGHSRKDRNMRMFSTVNRGIGLAISAMVAKIYHVIPSITIRHDNRKDTFSDTYNYQFCLNAKNQKYIDGKILTEIKSIEREEKAVTVYNFEVKEDNSYCVENVIVHNCQDISLAGKKRGFTHEDGSSTRSGLFFEALRIIHDTQPLIAIAENVKNLTGDGFKKEFDIVLSSLFSVGYNSYFCVLNSKDFGVPQNRERVFIISVRQDIPFSFHAPSGFPLTICLRDILEPSVPEKFYLSDAMIRNISGFGPTRYEMNPEIDREVANTIVASSHKIHRANEDTFVSSSFENGGGRVSIKKGYPELLKEEPKSSMQQLLQLYPNTGNPQAGRVYSMEGLSPTLDTVGGGNRMPKVAYLGNLLSRPTFNDPQEGRVYDKDGLSPTVTRQENNVAKILVHEGTSIGYAYAEEGDSINYERVSDNNRRGRVGKGISNTILAESSMDVAVKPKESSPLRVRRLTPGECFRLMGFTLTDSTLLSQHGISNTQLYHMAGNSIVVDVLMEIFKEIYI